MTMRIGFLVMLVMGATACTPAEPPAHPPGPSTVPPNRPTTTQGLATAVVASLRGTDPQAMVDLVVTVFDIGRTCPKLNPSFLSKRDKLVSDTRAHFAECQAMLDWAAATVTGTKGGEPRESSKCEGAKSLHDLVISVRAGAKAVDITLDDPIALNGAVLIGEDGLACKLVEGAN